MKYIDKYKGMILEEDENCSTVMDYVLLTKPRVMMLVVFTGLAGLVMAPGHIHPLIGFVAILCMTAGAGAAAALNMWYDRNLDALMTRTSKRPIVMGRIGEDEALTFGAILAVLSVIVMAVCVGLMASFLLLVTILFYFYVYTIWLKPRTPQNIVIGGAAGALPPMIGWAAVTGDVSFHSIILFLIIFLWTPPHFWALALYRSDEYKKGGIPMMPVVMGDDYTKRQIVIYTLLTVAASLAPSFCSMSSFVYGVFAALLGSMFIYYSLTLLPDRANIFAPRMFFFSIIYLLALFALMIIDHCLMG